MPTKIKWFFGLLFLAFTINAQQVWLKKSDNQFVLNTKALSKELRKITLSNTGRAILFPNLEGDIVPFVIYDNAVLSPALAKKYPQVHSYKGVSRYNNSQIIRFTCTPSGIEGTLIQGNKILNLTSKEGNDEYTLVNEELLGNDRSAFTCSGKGTPPIQEMLEENTPRRSRKELVGDNKFRTIRIAVTTTGEYSDFFVRKNNLQSGTEAQKKAAVLAGISTSLNNVNVAFERDLGVRFELISGNDQLIFLNRLTDPYEDSDSDNTLINKGANEIRNRIPFSDYDLGHLLGGRGSSGLAGVAGVCTTAKGDAITSFNRPEGFFFDFTLFAHELGHQLGGTHTQSASCARETPIEVGSGTTIMGYSGACGANNVQPESDPFFHSLSVNQILFVLSNRESDLSCGVQISTIDNSIPSIPFIPNYTVPLGLPIYLETTVTDVEDANNLTYSWEQFNQEIGPSPPQAISTSGSQFRVFSPVSSSRRDFPKSGVNSKWEVLPTVPRTLNFKLFVRDGKPGGVAISNTIQIAIVSTAERFQITSPNNAVTYDQNATEIITWNVAGTNQSPFNVSNVKIEYSYDGGKTYPVVLLERSPNTGEALIKTPIIPQGGIDQSNGKIRISAVDNAFYTFTDQPITLTNIVRQDFPTITMVSRQDLRTNYLIFNIKGSFRAPKDIVFFPIFRNTDTNEEINIEEELVISVDGGESYFPYAEDNFIMKAGTLELQVAIPLRDANDPLNTLKRLDLFLNIPEGSNNTSVLRTGSLIEEVRLIEDNVIVSNPTPRQVTFTVFTFPESNIYELKIFSVKGELINRISLTKNDREFTLDSLETGLYFAEITLGDLVTTKKFVIL